jgi:23S rRNA (adenine2503-C2)-methyltransferase
VKPDIRSFTESELHARFMEWDQPRYRVTQLLTWLYKKHVTSWNAMLNLPRELRDRLGEHYGLHSLSLVRKQGASDSTRKFLWQLADGAMIESVLIPANPALYGDASDRHTLCLSTQVGCAFGCRFCASGLDGWKRNLHVDEIVEQVLAVERWHQNSAEKRTGSSVDGSTNGRLVNNLVIMGMGEPLANYDNLLKALRILNAPWGLGIGARKITISTSGLVPQIRRLADEPLQFRLAISLHGATDEVRSKLMPVNRKHPVRELMDACEYFQAKKGQMITFEYILIDGLNDSPEHARALAALARRIRAKVNLIPYNKVDGLPWNRPPEAVQENFLAALERSRIPATLRREKGHDIEAACGQLRLQTERMTRAADADRKKQTRKNRNGRVENADPLQ